MKNIFTLLVMCISLCAFSQKTDSSYTLLDFYKDNWAKNSATGKYYEKHDLDSFARVNKTFKLNDHFLDGLSMEKIKEIFGEPNKILKWENKHQKTYVDYLYYGSQTYDVPGMPTLGKIQIEFDAETNKVLFFDRQHPLIREE